MKKTQELQKMLSMLLPTMAVMVLLPKEEETMKWAQSMFCQKLKDAVSGSSYVA